MKAGIVGLPSTGKTTLFRALTHGSAREESSTSRSETFLVGVVRVPDPRFDYLVQQYHPKKATPATIEFVDGAGKITDEERGLKIGRDFFADIRTVDALVHIVRCFKNPAAGIDNDPDPIKEVEILKEELVFSDLQIIETRLTKLQKSLHSTKAGVVTSATIERDLLLTIQQRLESGNSLADIELNPDQQKLLRSYDFVTLKPLVIVANISENEINANFSDSFISLKSYCDANNLPLTAISAKIEAEIAELPEEEQSEYLEAMGLPEPAVGKVVHEIYRALGLLSFFTAGEPEVRAWTLKEGSTVLEAAGTIHTDLARGFIRAEVGHFEDVKQAGSWEAAKQSGLVELHGKEYIVQDGDILYIRFKA